MNNLYKGEELKDFYIWINPKNWLVRHQIETVGGFFSGRSLTERKTNLMFIPNPEFKGDITLFQLNLMQKYIVEYQFEICREAFFKEYPSRLNAIFLFHSEEEAQKYKERNINHVQGRILKKVKSIGSYIYSKHDSSWVDFMRLAITMDKQSINDSCKTYWSGINVKSCELLSKGEPWTEDPIIETLFLGRIDFYDKNLAI